MAATAESELQLIAGTWSDFLICSFSQSFFELSQAPPALFIMMAFIHLRPLTLASPLPPPLSCRGMYG